MTDQKKTNLLNTVLFGGIGFSFVVVAVGAWLMLGNNDDMLSEDNQGNLEKIDFPTFIRGKALDGYLICPEDYCSATRPDAISPEINQSARILRDRLLDFADSQQNISMKELDPVNQQYSFLAHDSSKPFPDVITVRIISISENWSSVAIYSRTLIGEVRSNLNKTRSERWLSLLTRK